MFWLIQLEGLTQSLQAKHQESSFLQIRLSEAQQCLDMIQASWQGDLEEVKVCGTVWIGHWIGRLDFQSISMTDVR